MVASESKGTFIAGFVIGGLIGTAIAYIVAPQEQVVATQTHDMPWHAQKLRAMQPLVNDRSVNASLLSNV